MIALPNWPAQPNCESGRLPAAVRKIGLIALLSPESLVRPVIRIGIENGSGRSGRRGRSSVGDLDHGATLFAADLTIDQAVLYRRQVIAGNCRFAPASAPSWYQ